jgi:hypothetical protein
MGCLGVETMRRNPLGYPPRHRRLRTIAALAIAILATSCSSASTNSTPKSSGQAAASASPAATPAPATPVPTSSPLPFSQVAPAAVKGGSTPGFSPHWAGYTFTANNVTGVRAEWTEPTVHGHVHSEEFVWIGVGGWGPGPTNLIQDGTFAYFPSAYGTSQGIWYQRIPPNSRAKFPLVSVSPGDRVYASVERLPGSSGKWRLSVNDVDAGSTYTTEVKFHSRGTYPSFIVEDPNRNSSGPSGPFYKFARWQSVSFSNMQVRVGSKWAAAASLPAIQISMVRNGRTLAVAGPLSRRSSFTAVQR